MLARVLTLRFDPRLEAFDDQPLREFLAQRAVLAVREHFFQCNHVPYMAVMVTYALEPSTPNSVPRDSTQGRKGVDWRAQVAEAEIPLFDALRDWRAERARRDGVAPYMVCTNRQLAAMIEACPQSMRSSGPLTESARPNWRNTVRKSWPCWRGPGVLAHPHRSPTATTVRLPQRNPRHLTWRQLELEKGSEVADHVSDALTIFVAWQGFLAWLLPTTAKLPKHVCFTFVNRIDNLALDIAEDLVEARYSRSKAPVLVRANLRPEKLRVLLRVCNALGYRPHAAY